MASAHRNNPAKRKSSRAGPGANQPSFLKEHVPDGALPKSFTVRSLTSNTPTKQLRHVRRVYLNQAVTKGLGLLLGDLITIRRKNPDSTPEEDAIETAFGVAWPSTAVEVPVAQIHPMLRQSHLIFEGDKVKIEKYQGKILPAKEVSVCCIDERKPGNEADDEWSKALMGLLQEIKYITEGMDFECACAGRTHAFTVISVIEDLDHSLPMSPGIPTTARNTVEEMIQGLDNVSLRSGEPLLPQHRAYKKRTNKSTAFDSESTEDDTDELEVPDLFSFSDTTAVTIDHRPQSALPNVNAATPRTSNAKPDVTKKAADRTSSPSAIPSRPRSTNGTPRTAKRTSRNGKSNHDTSSRIVEIDSEEEEEIIKASSMPRVSYESIGGLSKQIASLREIVEMPLLHPTLFIRFGMLPPRGVLLYGPPGTGKTMLLRAIATETSARVFTISGPSIVSKYMGEAEEKLRAIWRSAESAGPSIIFVDEIDVITPKRDGDGGDAESRLVASFLTLMDGMDADSKVVVIGATNRPNAIDPALRRPGRFDREIEVGIPNASARLDILRVLLESIPHHLSDAFVEFISNKTHGFVGADLAAICREAVILTIKDNLRLGKSESEMYVEEEQLSEAFGLVRPSAMREIFLETPKTLWSDIGGQETVKQKLKESVEWPLTHPDTFKRLGVVPAKGVLLFGPPGCSKTLIARALATEAGLNFIAVKGPELFNKYVGEAERALREVFRKARSASPSIIFFDEIDALGTSREGDNHGSGDRLLTTLLNELDGIEDLVNVTILAATNRPDVIDSALLRPGRLDRLLYVGPPNTEARIAILRIQLAKMKVAPELSITALAQGLSGCSGAEIVACCREAGLLAMQRDLRATYISVSCFDDALIRVKRGITKEMIEFYEAFAEQYGQR